MLHKKAPCIAAAVALIAGSASAATIRTTDSFGLPPPGAPLLQQGVLTFDYFDDMGGARTLTRVEIALDYGVAMTGTFDNVGSGEIARATVGARYSVSVSGDSAGAPLSGTRLFFDTIEPVQVFENVPRFTMFVPFDIAGSGSDSIALTSLSDFIGPGPVFNWEFGLAFSADAAPVTSVSNGSIDAVARSKVGYGVVTITYTFDPPPIIPIPATLPLLAAGLAGLGFAARRRRN